MARIKKTRIIIAAFLAAVLLIGFTWAYTSVKTEPKNNVFSFSPEEITGVLEEPKWTGGEGANEGNNFTPDAARNMIPGGHVDKDPQIKNDCNLDEYAAIKLTFQNGAGEALKEAEMAKLITLIGIDYNTSDWALAESAELGKTEQTWYYKSILEPDDVTNAL